MPGFFDLETSVLEEYSPLEEDLESVPALTDEQLEARSTITHMICSTVVSIAI